MVSRTDLLDLLGYETGPPIVTVVAPPGYGKTTLLAEWTERNGQACAWVSVDDRDNDPEVFLTYVASALDRVESIDPGVFDALASPRSSIAGVVTPRLGRALYAASGGRWRGPARRTHEPHHLVFFSKRGLRGLAQRAGLRIRAQWFDRLALTRMDGSRALAAATAALLAAERALGSGLFVNLLLERPDA